jgi:uncharacterized membrane protein (UPF0127 family)
MKNKKNLILGIFLSLFMVFAGFYAGSLSVFADSGENSAREYVPPAYFEYKDGDHVPEYFENTVTIVSKDGTSHEFNIEIAATPSEQAKGLMFRESLAEDAGMLFLFKTVDERSFWMENTFIPLDLIFIEPDGTIQHIHTMAKPQDRTAITSGQKSKAVLEINGGTSDKLDIAVGDKVYHSAFRNRNLLAQ